jgi:hypothetical protein
LDPELVRCYCRRDELVWGRRHRWRAKRIWTVPAAPRRRRRIWRRGRCPA